MPFWTDPLAIHGTNPIPEADLPFRIGQGNWEAFQQAKFGLGHIYKRAESWARALDGIEKPWLCWNIDSAWCLVQQKLAANAGWTPVVGFDPRVGPPDKTVPGAVVIDFNEGLDLPVMYPHFVMEFVYLFADRLAFWHSDLLVRIPLLQSIAQRFDRIAADETIATKNPRSRKQILLGTHKRHWELIGCTTRWASRNQFETGAGWWMGFAYHPKCPTPGERRRRMACYWDHGAGIHYWDTHYSGRVSLVRDQGVHEGHCTKIGNTQYRRSVPINTSDARRNMTSELSRHFDLAEVCERLGLAGLL